MSVVQENPAVPIPVTIGKARGGPPRSVVLRKDRWWVQPLVIFLGLLAFVAYGTWAAFRNGHYYAGIFPSAGLHLPSHYLSPFYSPCITSSCPTDVVWGPAGGIGSVSPALLILIFPMGFRLTCYYYRKSYYRSFWASPPACAVADAGSARAGGGGARSRYTGETRFPLILQNIHRYFWYAAMVFAGILTWDAIQAFEFTTKTGGTTIGMGLGTVIFIVNAALIWAYTLGCHSCRHLCGGGLKNFSAHKTRHAIWSKISTPLNHRHQLFAWLSLIWIAWTDFYVFLLASGTIHDPRFF